MVTSLQCFFYSQKCLKIVFKFHETASAVRLIIKRFICLDKQFNFDEMWLYRFIKKAS